MNVSLRTTVLVGLLLLGAAAMARAGTDVVVLGNGDRITCTIKELDSGRLKISTDHMGTIYVEWLHVTEVVSVETFEVETLDGIRYVGSLAKGDIHRLAVVGENERWELNYESVIRISPIEQSFWKRLDGSFDLGLTYTQAETTSQFNLNSTVIYRRPARYTQLDTALALTTREDSPSTQRGDVTAFHLYERRTKLFTGFLGQAQRNEELGLDLRALFGFSVGRHFVRSSRSRLQGVLGLAVSEEWPRDTPSQESLEAFLGLQYRFFTYDFPSTDVSLQLRAFPSLSESSRLRIEASFSVKRELVKDFYVSLSVYESYDSAPLAADVARNDWGLATSIGWSF